MCVAVNKLDFSTKVAPSTSTIRHSLHVKPPKACVKELYSPTRAVLRHALVSHSMISVLTGLVSTANETPTQASQQAATCRRGRKSAWQRQQQHRGRTRTHVLCIRVLRLSQFHFHYFLIHFLTLDDWWWHMAMCARRGGAGYSVRGTTLRTIYAVH